MMMRVYGYPRVADGITRREYVILSSPTNRNLLQAVHDAAINYCIANEDRNPCKDGGMSFAQVMEHLTPEMLAVCDVKMTRLEDLAIQTDQLPPIVSRFELESIWEFERMERLHPRETVDSGNDAAPTEGEAVDVSITQ